ncbi:MAG: prephenate dehydratase [Solirubrobacteraceae bacterium]|jgi:prephenate dehydratase|nr:prephenate dehydratase [Solirubrobacteraceae bacterium]
MRVGFLGPAGTYSEEAVLAGAGAADLEPVPLPTVHDAVAAVREGRVERALVPIENSLEGSVNATLDALAQGDGGVQITGELVHPIHHCLIARAAVPLERIAAVTSHPQASGQCAAYLRSRLPGATVLTAASTADAVRLVAERPPGDGEPWAAIGSRAAAALYGCAVLEGDVEDPPGSETRFVWIARTPPDPETGRAWKTALLFWEPDDDRPGWLVRCLAEFADRGVNLTRIESRPRREGLGSYMFFVDLDGYTGTPAVAAAIEALRAHAAAVRVLGSFPTAP